MVVNIKATGMEMTDAIRNYAEEKVEGLLKFFDNIQQADIDVGMESHHHNKGKIYYAEINVYVPNKIVRVRKDAEDLYKAIDKTKDHLKIMLDEMKNKMRRKDKKVLREIKGYQEEE